MPDHEFEKKIQEKMAELRLQPSAPVWDKVEQQLDKKEKRRRGVLWIPFFLAAAVAVFFLINQSTEPGTSKAEAGSPVAEAKTYPQVDRHIGQQLDTARMHEEDGVIEDPLSNIDTAAGIQHLLPKTIKEPARDVVMHDIIPSPIMRKDVTEKERQGEGTGSYQQHVTPADNKLGEAGTPTGRFDTKDMKESGRTLLPSRVKVDPVNFLRGNFPVEVKTPEFRQTEMKRASRKKTPVEFGITASFGRSHITNGEISQLFTNAMVLSDAAGRNNVGFGGSASPGPVAPVYIAPSRLKAGAGFTAGGYFKKQVTPVIWLSIGLNYKLFSTANSVGLSKDTFILQSNSSNAVTLEKVYVTGSSGQHINYFHFIELPLSAEGRLINGRLPLTWHAGASFSRLIASNTLHYDSRYRVYYKQNSLLQKNQLNLHTAITTKIFLRSRKPLTVGPEFSYGVSNLLKNKNDNPKHFTFLGLKTAIALN
jgi:hypothetical protein